MKARWARIETATGRIVGMTRNTEALALASLSEGQELQPAPEGVDGKSHRWDAELQAYVTVGFGPIPALGYRQMRRTGYDDGDQIGALMKVVQALASGDPIPPEAQAEFDAVAAHVAAIKAANPKT